MNQDLVYIHFLADADAAFSHFPCASMLELVDNFSREQTIAEYEALLTGLLDKVFLRNLLSTFYPNMSGNPLILGVVQVHP
jgi:hypothetical protein